jgi:hypothetical protein
VWLGSEFHESRGFVRSKLALQFEQVRLRDLRDGKPQSHGG